mgnify:CR=1 FL=1
MSAARREFEAYQAFVLDTKLFWTSQMFGALNVYLLENFARS